jgi:hypothetical protein
MRADSERPVPRHTELAPVPDVVLTPVGLARYLVLADGRWALIAERDLHLKGLGRTPAEALRDFELRVGVRQS